MFSRRNCGGYGALIQEKKLKDSLLDWMEKALASGIKRLAQFACRIARHLKGILNYFLYPITTAMVEGKLMAIEILSSLS